MGCVRVGIPRKLTMSVDVFWGVKPCIMKMEAAGRSECQRQHHIPGVSNLPRFTPMIFWYARLTSRVGLAQSV
jgi:hypothetical protein